MLYRVFCCLVVAVFCGGAALCDDDRCEIADVAWEHPKRARHAKRLEQLEAVAMQEDEKLAEFDRLEAVKSDKFIQKQLSSIEGLRTHAVGDDELQAVERAKALAEDGHLAESEAEIKIVMEGVVGRLDSHLKDSRDRAHLASESTKIERERIMGIKEGLGITEEGPKTVDNNIKRLEGDTNDN